MQDLLQTNQHFGLDIIQSTPLSQNNFGPRKSNVHPLFFQNPIFIFGFILILNLMFADPGPFYYQGAPEINRIMISGIHEIFRFHFHF